MIWLLLAELILLHFAGSLNTKLWGNPVWKFAAKFQTLDVWFIITRACMFVIFGMDTEQILQIRQSCFGYIHSLATIKEVEYIFRNRVSIAYVTALITRQYQESPSYCSSLMIDSWSTAREARQPGEGETVSFYRWYTERCPVMYINAQHIVYRIAYLIFIIKTALS